MNRSPDLPDYEPYVEPPEGPTIRVYGHVEGDVVSAVQVARRVGYAVDAREPAPPPQLTLCLLDAAGAVVAMDWAQWEFMRLYGGGDPRTGPIHQTFITRDFHAEVAAREGGVTLAIFRGDQLLWQCDAPEYPPRIEDVRCVFDGTTVRLTWSDAVAPGRPYRARVRWSYADHPTPVAIGAQYLRPEPLDGPLAPEARRGEFVFDGFQLAPEPVLLHVEIQDGFHTTVSEPVRVTGPDRPIDLSMLGPLRFPEGTVFMASARFRPYHMVVGEHVFRWFVDGVERGEGARLIIDPLPPGRHVVEVRFSAGTRTATAVQEVSQPE